MATRRNESPEPSEGGREDMEDADDCVGRMHRCAGWCAYTDGANIDGDGSVENIGHDGPRDNDTGIGAGFSRLVFDVFPDERCGIWDGIDVEEEEWAAGVDAEFFEVWVDAVLVDVIDSNEPGILGVGEREFALARFMVLEAWRAQRHVVGHRVEFASAREGEMTAFAGDDILAEEQSSVGPTMDMFEHLALAAA